MKIGIAADHRGYKTKEKIKDYFKNKYEIIDYGTDSEERVDYPIYGIKLGEKVRDKEVEYGIAICGSAIGISIACNKVNIIAISGETPIEKNIEIIEAFINAKENKTDPVYIERINQITRYENER